MQLSPSPKVSIVIPLFNGAEYISTTLENVLSQTFTDYEVLVVDDGSEDDSGEKVAAFNDPRIKLIRQDNAGVSAARNAAIMESSAEYVAFIDSDDLWHIEKLGLQVDVLDSNTALDFCYSDRDLFYDNALPQTDAPILDVPVITEKLFPQLLKHNHIHCSSVMVRRSLFAKIGLFDVTLAASEDSDLWIKAANLNSFCRVNVCLSFYRRHKTNTINSINFRRNRVHAELMFFVRWLPHQEARKIVAENIMGNSHALAYEEEALGNHQRAIWYFLLAFTLGKRQLKLLVKALLLLLRR